MASGPTEGRPPAVLPSTALGWAAGAGAFAVELALIATLALACYRLAGDGARGWLAGALATVALLLVWGRWMAPRARRRLPLPGRLVLGCGLVLAASVLAYASGLTTWAWWFGTAGLALTAAGQSLEGR